jgi:hypothetical protein
MTRTILTALVAASVMAFAPQAMAQSNPANKGGQTAQPGGSAPAAKTTVKASHSSSSSYKEAKPDKPTGQQGGSAPPASTTVKGSKSNASE